MLKTLFKLAVLLLIVNALWQVVPPYWRYVEFRKAVQEIALKGFGKDSARVAEEVLELAARHKVPVDREGVQVKQERISTAIDVVYVESATPVPGWRVTRPLEIHAEVRHVR